MCCFVFFWHLYSESPLRVSTHEQSGLPVNAESGQIMSVKFHTASVFTVFYQRQCSSKHWHLKLTGIMFVVVVIVVVLMSHIFLHIFYSWNQVKVVSHFTHWWWSQQSKKKRHHSEVLVAVTWKELKLQWEQTHNRFYFMLSKRRRFSCLLISSLTNNTAEVIISQRAAMTKKQTSHADSGHRRQSCEYVVCFSVSVCANLSVCVWRGGAYWGRGHSLTVPEMTGISPDVKAPNTQQSSGSTNTLSFPRTENAVAFSAAILTELLLITGSVRA